jgi:hypothetical protein
MQNQNITFSETENTLVLDLVKQAQKGNKEAMAKILQIFEPEIEKQYKK